MHELNGFKPSVAHQTSVKKNIFFAHKTPHKSSSGVGRPDPKSNGSNSARAGSDPNIVGWIKPVGSSDDDSSRVGRPKLPAASRGYSGDAAAAVEVAPVTRWTNSRKWAGSAVK